MYVHKSIKIKFLEAVQKWITRFWGAAPETNPDNRLDINLRYPPYRKPLKAIKRFLK